MINSQFENHLEMITAEFRENIGKYEKIYLLYHSDADGICSGLLVERLLQKFRKPFSSSCLNLSKPWKTYLSQLELNSELNNAVIVSDLCPSSDLLYEYAVKFPKTHFFILDHHQFKWPEDVEPPNNVYNANPTLFGLHGLKEIVGSALNYLFTVSVDESLSKYAWLAAIGIAGDTLNHVDDYRAYNKLVIEQAVQLEQVEVKEGICLYGGQHLRLDSAMASSIFPFLPQVEGSQKKAKQIISSLSLDPSKKIEDLSYSEAEKLAAHFPSIKILGEYLILPNKKGLLRYSFEHAQVISIFGHDSPNQARALIGRKFITQEAKKKYNEYISRLVQNLTIFLHLPKITTHYAIFVDLTGQIHKAQWSDTGSFASVNHIYDGTKMLFIGGKTNPDSEEYKLSVRCTPDFIAAHGGHGAVHVIHDFSRQYGGHGGGHGLAGGIRLTTSLYQKLQKEVDRIIQLYTEG